MNAHFLDLSRVGLMVMAMFGWCSARSAGYVVTDLGAGTAWGINAAGKVAATVQGQAVLFDGKSNVLLPVIYPQTGPWFTPTDAVAVNDADQVLANGDWFTLGPAVAVYTGGGGQVVRGGYGLSCFGTGINQAGTACGYLDHAMTLRLTQGFVTGQADSPPLTFWYGINASGVTVGKASTNSFSVVHTFFYQPRACLCTNGLLVFLDPRPVPGLTSPDDDLSAANSINDRGWVTGFVRPEFPGPRRAFVYRGGSLETLGTLGGAESEARGINNQNAVVGWALTATGARHAFLYQANDLTDLNDHLPEGSGWELQQANGINTAGQIVGFGRFQGATHAFLLSPTDPQLAIATYAGITVSGETGARYRLEHAPHAAGDPWTQWLQIELTNRTQTFIDFDSPQHPRRIYRAVRLDP